MYQYQLHTRALWKLDRRLGVVFLIAWRPSELKEERVCLLFIVWTRVLRMVLEYMIRASIIRAMGKHLGSDALFVDIREWRKRLSRIEYWMEYGWWAVRQ